MVTQLVDVHGEPRLKLSSSGSRFRIMLHSLIRTGGRQDRMATPDHLATAHATPTATTVFLFGDTFAAPAAPGTKGKVAFATGVVVQTEALAQMMYAVGLASLHQRGVIKLSAYAKKRLRVFTSSGVQIETLPGGTPLCPDDPLALAVLKPTRKGAPRTVHSLIRSLLPGAEAPYEQVIRLGVDSAVRLGYLQRSKSGGVLGVRKHTDLTAVPDRIASLRTAAEALADDWAAFRTANGDLAAALRADVGRAIEATRRSDTDNLDFD
jgi:hypothetical protein